MKLVLALVLLVGTARADVALWTEAGVEHAVAPRVDVTFDQQLRFDAGVSRIGAVLPELGVRVRLVRWLRAGASYRYEYERDGDDMMVTRHRFDGFVRARADVRRLRVEVESRIEEEMRPTSRDTERSVLRERLEIAWRHRRWTPSASVTLFDTLDRGALLDKVWWTAGVAHDRHGREVEVFYRYAVDAEATLHVVGVAVHAAI